MKEYHSIPGVQMYGEPCFAFYKYDGSNIRALWNRKSGWCRFGTRHRLFDKTDEIFGGAIDLFKETYATDLENKFRREKSLRNIQEAIVFCEFFGPNSFAGLHHTADPKELVMFDINIHKNGIMPPKEFIDTFGDLKIAKLVYQGNLTREFERQVREGEFSDLDEGVICKGYKGKHKIWMCKIKTNKYLQKLKDKYADKWQEYWE